MTLPGVATARDIHITTGNGGIHVGRNGVLLGDPPLVSETFTRATADPRFIATGSACLTGAPPGPAVNRFRKQRGAYRHHPHRRAAATEASPVVTLYFSFSYFRVRGRRRSPV